ncbi:Tc toxin subunit A-related protein [Paenibacillus durus]|uniref:Tc toxin subunit A-related protein n=1 Tax=Paenibacillus durus TaxID=44251 RepID=UPI0005A86690|nr:neuraminidase-like domain-containing protein [Paenibacillus durus]
MNRIIFPQGLKISPDTLGGRSIGELQSALQKLKLDISPSDLARKEMGTSTQEAIRTVQERVGLPADGKLTKETVAKLNAELAHTFVAGNKTRTQRLQELLQRVGQPIDPEEIRNRRFGPSTEQVLKRFQANMNLAQDGRVSDEVVARLRAEALKARFSSKGQVAVLHRTLLRALHTAKLGEVRVDHGELRGRHIGASTRAALKALQQKYGLPSTGELDPDTYDRLISLAASIPQPIMRMKPGSAGELKPIRKTARLNMKARHVNDVQEALAYLGYSINEQEFKSQTFGKSTREALVEYQRTRLLPVTGHAEGPTLESLNRDLRQVNPLASEKEYAYRVRGSVRDPLWAGMGGIKIQVWERLIGGPGALLSERQTAGNGFFDIPYEPPRDSATKQIKRSFSLEVKALGVGNQEIGSRTLVNPTMICWANFTQGDEPYRGISEFESRMAELNKAIAPTAVKSLVQTEQNRQISEASLRAGMAAEDIMRLVLAHLAADKLKHPVLGPEACYAYIGQNLPPSLPGDLIESTEDWELIDQLVESACGGLVFMDGELQASAFGNAITLNLMPIAVVLQKQAILDALAALKRTYALEKPILIGNGSLQALLEASPGMKPHSGAVADTFIKFKSLGPDFWSHLSENAVEFGGKEAVAEFETVVNVGHITKNFKPMLNLLKQKIADPNFTQIQSVRDLAKLTTGQWEDLINENGGQVPPNTDGTDNQASTYAATLASQSERLFPAVALAAAVSRSESNPLPHAAEVQKLLDQHPDLELRTANLNVFFEEKGITDSDVLQETRVLQRVHRIAPTAMAGQALLDLKIHNSAQIMSLGKAQFAEALTATQLVDKRTALTVYGLAEYQYAQVLQRIADYRLELHGTNPRAIMDFTFTPEELPSALAGSSDLETLFGSLDFCDCADCQSVCGPSAYLADLLRYLDSHNSETAGKTVKDVLFGRRPDIGNIKLNCENTETPLPYIDLVCEVLENAIPAPSPNFSFQTTRTAAELRAFPEHVKVDAYNTLKAANYPLDNAFNLWQEEARGYLQHLGVPRWELMEAFQTVQSGAAPSPSNVSIAGEYWGMSTHETGMVTVLAGTAASQTVFWGFDANLTEIAISGFMRHSRLSYGQLLDLLCVRWINPPGDPGKMVIERPNATCDTDMQKIVNLTPDRLDKMHRFLRLWRHTGWAMWELDLLIRNTVLGGGIMNQELLARLKRFRQVQERLGLPADETLALYGDINTEIRVQPDKPERSIDPLYKVMFLNPAVVSPADSGFVLPLDGSGHLPEHKATLLAAFALTEADLELLLARLGNNSLTLANLSKLNRYVVLKRGLGIGIKDLLAMESLSGAADIFASPQTTLEFIGMLDWVAKSGMSADELDYLLNFRPESPYGLREEAITGYVAALREALRSSAAAQREGTIISQVAAAFTLPPGQVQLLLGVILEGKTLGAHLNAPALTLRDGTGVYTLAITAGNFPEIYRTYRLLHKLAKLLTRLKMTRDDLGWLLQKAGDFNLLNPGVLPVTGSAVPAAPLFPAWLALFQWLSFKGLYPEPEGISLRTIFDLAMAAATPSNEIIESIAELTQWNLDDLNDLAAGLGLQHGGVSSDYTRIGSYLRLLECFKLIKRTGIRAGTLLAWSNRDNDTGGAQALVSQQIRQAVKSRYDYSVWLDKAAPMEDALREKKRNALISYLVETSQRTASPDIEVGGKKYANPSYWRDANDLLEYYLIDVEMGVCQLTSRIKQAISSVQMFVQRCMLGLEQPFVEVSRAEQQETVTDNSWSQWKWMKSYRIWEANRKVFLYPENWIEPELRDDKSPFFKELEAEIMQKDITFENAQTVFLNYVQKVHEVARLEITGVYYELDDTDPRDNLAPDINLFHVIGRTRAHPSIYYYRRFDLNYGEWTAWEKIDVDIQSNQVIPVVYNRQLYLFWLSFIEKPQKVKKQPPAKPSNDTNVPETPNQIEIQLAWSMQKDGGWTAKRVSKQKLIHPWQRPLYAYNLKPRYKSRENLLWLDIYISQSPEFNSTRFWDAYRNTREYVTATHPYDERARPWHSSSFVFDGEVVDVKMKGLNGQYHVPDSSGVATDALTQTNSYTYVHDNFGEEGRAIHKLSGPYEIAPRLPLPAGMHYDNVRLANDKRLLNGGNANVLQNGHTQTLLSAAKSPFEIVFSQHQIAFDTAMWGRVPLFYQDNFRTFFIKPEWQQVIVGYNQTLQTYNYNFYPFYHPYTALFMRELNRSGVDGLLNRRIQLRPQEYYPGNNFSFGSYSPSSVAKPDSTVKHDIVDFERYGAYSIYNWEIFFHAPLMIACRLSANQRFEEAMRWFHYIFDPTNVETPNVPQRYWITRPFFEQSSDDYRKQRIENLLRNIEQHSDELKAWKNHPFKPHLIARYRPVAYQKAVVMKYLDNLIAWGDQLFRRDTIESINEATTLYVLAYKLLGRRPVKVPGAGHADRSYNELTADGALDPFGNKQVDVLMENFTDVPVRVTRTAEGAEPLPRLEVAYFSIPNNGRLLEYWNTVEDRLFKIRHCMNIEGAVRQLPLFEPPVDPALLVKAAAAGVDLGSVMSDIATAPSPYRFERLAQKAAELCGEVKTLGDKLLSVLEKFDAEGLALLRSTQEIRLLQAVREVRMKQVEEANESWASLELSKLMAAQKKEYFTSRDLISPWEGIALGLGGISAAAQAAIAVGYALAGGLALIPRFTAGAAGFGGSPEATVDAADGLRFSKAAEAAVMTLSAVAAATDKLGSLASTMGGYWRRKEEWDFQGGLAETEILQIDKQIAGAKVRLAIAEKELENHELQIEEAHAADEYMRSKYTNQQLYEWQIRQVSSIYFQSYQMAYDMVKRAEKCFQFETGNPASTFVQFGYWDSLKKGLLAGERLTNDLRRMEAAYLESNTRDLELTKHVSLAEFLPLSLLALKEGGACSVILPEWLFDMDYPGHFSRRIKTVSISIPCVTGPYTGVNCTLSLTNHGIRINDNVAAGYGNPLAAGDIRFYKSPVPVTAIATSHGQNDAGMFELNFEDDRYLPFEGAGAVSEWRIQLPQENNQFDMSTISDVIIHLRYTAKASGNLDLVKAAKDNVAAILPPSGKRLLVLNHEFGTAWQRFLHPVAGAEQVLTFALDREHLPFYARGKSNINLTKIDLFVETKETGSFSAKLKVPGAAAASDETMNPDPAFGGSQHLAKSGFAAGVPLLGEWQLQIKKSADTDFKSLQPGIIRNAYLVVEFKTS